MWCGENGIHIIASAQPAHPPTLWCTYVRCCIFHGVVLIYCFCCPSSDTCFCWPFSFSGVLLSMSLIFVVWAWTSKRRAQGRKKVLLSAYRHARAPAEQLAWVWMTIQKTCRYCLYYTAVACRIPTLFISLPLFCSSPRG